MESNFVGLRGRTTTELSDDLSNYRQPKLAEPQNDRVKRYCDMMSVSIQQMEHMHDSFLMDLRRGLEAHKNHASQCGSSSESNMLVLDSYVSKSTDGREEGVFYGMNVGENIFRMTRVKLLGKGGDNKMETSQMQLNYERGMLDAQMPAATLFNHFAENLKCLMEIHGDIGETRYTNVVTDGDMSSEMEKLAIDEQRPAAAAGGKNGRVRCLGVGLTFCFPCEQMSIKSSKLLRWGKGFATGRATNDPVEGRDVGELLQDAFDRQGIPLQLKAVLNDTVGTLVTCAYNKHEDGECCISVIMGEGFNCCYVEPQAELYNYVGKIVNVECGYFSGADLPLTDVDAEIDWRSENRGKMRLEKIVAGANFGEIVRLIILKVFQDRAPPTAWIENSLSVDDVLQIASDVSPAHDVSETKLLGKWGVTWTEDDINDLHSIASKVVDRSCACAAVAICCLARQSGKLTQEVPWNSPGGTSIERNHQQQATGDIVVAVDGSLASKNPLILRNISGHVRRLIGEETARRIKLVATDDGSSIGAAILAATEQVRC
eukprot:GHVS01091347.1.p1 GENE.GHVS01091347.1~~GHVS01091347.1.p1  ORF type:complete len:545 (+),score=85.12 GHVS01091347.1:42-1676(+)